MFHRDRYTAVIPHLAPLSIFLLSLPLYCYINSRVLRAQRNSCTTPCIYATMHGGLSTCARALICRYPCTCTRWDFDSYVDVRESKLVLFEEKNIRMGLLSRLNRNIPFYILFLFDRSRVDDNSIRNVFIWNFSHFTTTRDRDDFKDLL